MRNLQRRQVGVVILLGLPGSGKGTQAGRLAEALGVNAVSTGEMLRREIENGSSLGHSVQDVIERGALVGDDVVSEALARRLAGPEFAAGFVVDGFPRTIAQARFLEQWLDARGWDAPTVVYLDLKLEQVAARLAARRQCPVCDSTYSSRYRVCKKDGAALVSRADDNAASLRERFREYEDRTRPLLDYYAGSDLHRVDAAASPEQVFEQIMSSLTHSRRAAFSAA